jgi:peptide/nickel transport system permease protein
LISRTTRAGLVGVSIVAVVTVAAHVIATHDPATQFPDLAFAPPMLPHVVDDDGHVHRPFIYPIRLVDRLEHRFVQDRSVRVPLEWFTARGLVTASEARGPWLLLGGDAIGRDVFARVLLGARMSLGVSLLATVLALCLGAAIGALAGVVGGKWDAFLMRLADFVLVLPIIYVVIVLRATMPLVLSTTDVFWAMTLILGAAGWPFPARGVRAVVATEKRKEYAEAAHALGAGWLRILLRHLLPAAHGFMAVQATLLIPMFILAEATLSYVGFGFAEPTPSWGVMLREAAEAGTLSEAPWLLAPAAAIVISVLCLHLVSGGSTDSHDHGVVTS